MTKQIDLIFAEYLKDLRKMSHIRLRELSEKSGYGTSHIGRIENGNRRPNADYLLTVAPYLGVPQGFLLTQAGYKLDPSEDAPDIPDKFAKTQTLAYSLIQELITDAVVEVSVNGRHSMARIVKVNFAK